MNNKAKKIISYIFISVLLSILMIDKVFAANFTSTVIEDKSFNSKKYPTNYSYDYVNGTIKKGTSYTRYILKPWAFYVTQGSTKRQVFCIEQYRNAYSEKTYEKYNCEKNNSGCVVSENKKKDLIKQAISVGYHVTSAPDNKNFDKEIGALNKLTNDKTYETIALQEIIWEIIRGERTSFTYYAPDTCKSGVNEKKCLFYSKIYNKGSSTPEGKLLTKYKGIIKKAKYTFDKIPKNFGTNSKPGSVQLTYNEKKKVFTADLHDSNGAYNNFNFKSSNKNIKLSASADGKTLTITSTISIEKDTPIKITATNIVNDKSDYIEYHTTQNSLFQKFGYGTAEIQYFLGVYTPKYKIEIVKQDQNGNTLAGAEFKICNKKGCPKGSVIVSNLKTNSAGVAAYDQIAKPGTYYVRETKAPTGYNLYSKEISVTVNKNVKIPVKNTPNTFKLKKYIYNETDNSKNLLDTNCDPKTGPIFEIYHKNNGKYEKIYFTENKIGSYNYHGTKNGENTTSELTTCNGTFEAFKFPDCKDYKIVEIKAPEGVTLSNFSGEISNICNKTQEVINGFTGLEFQKKNDDGELLDGGTYILQTKINNVYTDVLLKKTRDGEYSYQKDLDDSEKDATYELKTDNGKFLVKNLPPGEYRIVEAEAPEGYELIKDKDSKALVTITDENKDGYYLVEMINYKVNKDGDNAFAELIVTITTGRKVLNYVFIISGLAILLGAVIIIRKKIKK